MELKYLIFPYWCMLAIFIGRAIYIEKFHIIPTLKKYGGDYEIYFSPSKKKAQLKKYIDICQANNLPAKYSRYLKSVNIVGFFLFVGWVILLSYA